MKTRTYTYTLLIICALLAACTDSESTSTTTESTAGEVSIPVINYGVAQTHPHDTSAFTEGLQVYNGKVYESTGSPVTMPQTRSIVGELDVKTGQLRKKVELDRSRYFGEGMVFLNGKLYQLTYTTKIGFVYDAQTFRQTGTFTFPSKEGWGLTTDGTNLIMSDGTATLTYLNPETFQVAKTLSVTDDHGAVVNLNELEYVRGFIYANVYTTATIVKIDPQSGKVVGRLDLSSLQQDAKAKNPKALEMNGIAFDSTANSLYITGKFWPTLYEIKVPM